MPAIWALGMAASALVHTAGAGALLISLAPDPLPQQPAPESSLNLQAHRIPRSEAVPQAAESEQAPESQAHTQGLAAGSIPQSKAQPKAPAADSLEPAAAKASAAPQSQAPADRLASAAAPLSAAPAAQPNTAALPQAAPDSQPSPAAQPDTVPLPGADPDPQSAPAAVPDAPRIKAALAFQGGSGDIDPVSLAAFQSFMQPGDAAAEGDPLRDGVSGILAAVPCSRLQVAFVPETATLQVRGHLPEDGLRTPVLAALQAQMGTDITVSDNMRLLPRPQCGALAGIANVGLPQSTDQITNPLLVGSDAHARVLDYSGGERLFFDLTAPDYPAYVYVDYFDAGGAVLHLSPNELAPLAEAAPKTALRVGAKEAGDPGLQITVAPPYGQEIAVAFAASHPLYEGLRPLSEPAGPYLDFLRTQVAAARAEHAGFKGEWVYFLITTHAP
ncbi:DUF4384 domain-containing protein [Leisingera sp. SS27]|uniref:DUF4384 domain-containing protein n=1 Tax=Leisingera sp. SS27 TaxID=2979462 RepID=UPI00232CB755|nr:DUF4384 domain-containing protein [Leisingera sp. SS27]MDC0660500.1 DUF4384 domain-containing protein [Leisingera sp. SS27]